MVRKWQMNNFCPQNTSKLFEYANTNTALFQGTDQSWAPLELDNLVDFAADELQVLEPGSRATSTDGEKGNPQTTKMVCRFFPPGILAGCTSSDA
jgi:hypothetical protein